MSGLDELKREALREALRGAVARPRPIHIYSLELHDAQSKVLKESGRFNVLACGRRWGKTTLGVLLVCKALKDGKKVAWGAPLYKYLADPYRTLTNLLHGHIKRSVQDRTIELVNGGRIDFWTLDDQDAGRGLAYHLWVVDEAAMIKGLEAIVQKAIGPTLTDYRGGLWLLSTPRGQSNAFARFYQKGVRKEASWRSWSMPTLTNTTLEGLDEEVAQAKASLPPAVFAQEYEADFTRPAGAVYDCFDNRLETKETGSTNVVAPFEIPGDTTLGIDFGSANTAIVSIKEHKGIYYVVGSYHAAGDDPKKHIERSREKFGKEKHAFGGSNSEDEWRKRWRADGMYIRKPSVTGPGSVSVRISTLYQLFREKKLKVFSTCQPLIDEILAMTYKLDGDDHILDVVEDQNIFHRQDALGYAMVSISSTGIKRLGGRFDKPDISEKDIYPLPVSR